MISNFYVGALVAYDKIGCHPWPLADPSLLPPNTPHDLKPGHASHAPLIRLLFCAHIDFLLLSDPPPWSLPQQDHLLRPFVCCSSKRHGRSLQHHFMPQ